MLYYLKDLAQSFGPLNIFQYITFRVGGATLTALALSLLLGPFLIRILRKHRIGQIQRSDGPKTHLSKHGTPTMGGLMIFATMALSVVLWMRPDNRFTWLLIGVALILGAVGFCDDYIKLVKRNAAGIPSWAKFMAQVSVGLAVVSYLAIDPPNAVFLTDLNIPYAKDVFVGLGPFYFVLAVLMIVGSSNAVNLTDGLDGLAAGSLIFCAVTYGLLAYTAGHAKFSDYLGIIPVDGAGEIAVFMGAMVGSCMGFLWFNTHPAEVFMGDTGSLFLGATIATAALCVKQELLLPIVGGIFVIETLSVILQMASFKIRKGRRIFKMAPLHHHFELSGISEPKVTVRFWIVGIVLMLTALASLKIR